MHRTFLLCLSAGLVLMLSGCETVKGLGRDITNAGEAIEDAVR